MIIKPFPMSDEVIHGLTITFNLPQVHHTQASKTFKELLLADATLLATRMVTHLTSRSQVLKRTISSNYATVVFTAVTPETLWVSHVTGEKGVDKSINYTVIPVDPVTGHEKKATTLVIREDTYDNLCLFRVSYAASFYKAVFLKLMADDMKTKVPGAYSAISRSVSELEMLPYLSADLDEMYVGAIPDVGFITSSIVPLPGLMSPIKYTNLPLSFKQVFNDSSVDSKLKKLILPVEGLDLTEVIGQFQPMHAGYIDGIPFLYTIPLTTEAITISDGLSSNLVGDRQNLVWIFSELSRLFEFNGQIEISRINENLRYFQNKLKDVVADEYYDSLYFEQSPMDLEDLCYRWFNYESLSNLSISPKHIWALFKSLDVSKVRYNVERVSTGQASISLFNKISSGLHLLTPGLVLLNEEFRNMIHVELTKSTGQLHLIYTRGSDSCIFKLTPQDQHSFLAHLTGDVLTKIKDSQESLESLNALCVITLWLCNGDKNKDILFKKENKILQIEWPAHVLRRYSKMPFFFGKLKLWVKG